MVLGIVILEKIIQNQGSIHEEIRRITHQQTINSRNALIYPGFLTLKSFSEFWEPRQVFALLVELHLKKNKKSLESVEKIKRICFFSSLSTIRDSIWLQSIRFNILWPQIGETGNCRFHVLPISEISLTRLKKRKRRRIKINHNDFRQLGLLFHI